MEQIRAFVEDSESVDYEPKGCAYAFVRRKPAARQGASGWYSLRDLYDLDAA